jgi:hypothetical protein
VIKVAAFDQGDGLGEGADIASADAICDILDFDHMQNLEKRFNARSLCSLETQRHRENI